MNYKKYLNLTREQRLEFFMDNLSITNKTPEYFINWTKVQTNTRKYELHLNTLDYLLGKDDIEAETLELVKKQPDLLKAVPSLIANRERVTDYLVMEEDTLIPKNLNFTIIDTNRLSEYVEFMKETGLLDFIQNDAKRSLVDYVYGVEAGLDSNARKNRSGQTMEAIVENFIKVASKELNIEYISQATAKKIKNMWDIEVPVDKARRSFDFAIYNKMTDKLFLVETNYYNGGGSKLKSVSGEFIGLNNLLKISEQITFLWVTDGQGWNTARAPLSEAFYSIDNIFNLELLSNNILLEFLSK